MRNQCYSSVVPTIQKERKEILVRSEEGKKKQYAYINEYKKKRFKNVTLELDKDFYENALIPAVEKKGMSVTAYIKEAIIEKIEACRAKR